MKYIFIILTAVAFASCTQNGIVVDTDKPTELATELDTISYLLGTNLAKDLADNGGMTEIDKRSLLHGMQRVFDGKEMELSEADAKAFMQSYFTKVKEKQTEEATSKGREFLEENKTKEGVQVTPSGLQYKIITKGEGAIPTREDDVSVHYTGMFIDGKVFDSSVERGQPLSLSTTGVIPGWTEALTMMPVGSKWELTIPSELGYGERGSGPIPGNSVLVFEVELLDIVTPTE